MFYHGTIFPNLHWSCNLNRCQMPFEAVMAEVSCILTMVWEGFLCLYNSGKHLKCLGTVEMVRVISSQSCDAEAQWALTVPTPWDLLVCLERAVTHLWPSTRAFCSLSWIITCKRRYLGSLEGWRCWLGCPDLGHQLTEQFFSHTNRTQLGGSRLLFPWICVPATPNSRLIICETLG